MPVSRDDSVLFIHIPKNAGKSVEIALGVCTAEEQDSARWRSSLNRAATAFQRMTAERRSFENLWGIVDITLTAQHLTYAEIYLLGLIECNALERMTKLAICRNPYDRAVSTFFHMAGAYEKSSQGFEAFWRDWPEETVPNHNVLAHRRRQWEFCVGLDGENAMDHIIHYEDISSEFENFAVSTLGARMQLPWSGRSREARDYRQFYNERSKKLILNRFERDFDFFHYSKEL